MQCLLGIEVLSPGINSTLHSQRGIDLLSHGLLQSGQGVINHTIMMFTSEQCESVTVQPFASVLVILV